MADTDVRQQILVERLPSLLRDIYEGTLLLPEATTVPWDAERRLRLFERIYLGLPVGNITVWRTSRRLEHRRSVGSVPLLERGEGTSRDYLVDELGWVLTLFAEVGPAFWLGDKSSQRKPLITTDPPRSFIAFELQTQTFRLIEPGESLRPTEFALSSLFDAAAHHAKSVDLRSQSLADQWSNRLSRLVGIFFDFSFPVTTIVSDSMENARLLLTPLKEPTPPTDLKTTRWYCDTCGQPIRHASEGWVEWLIRYEEAQPVGRGLRLVHHRPASPRPHGCQYNQAEEAQLDGSVLFDSTLMDFLGPDGLTYLLSLTSRYNLPQKQVIEMLKRLHTPGYERARFHAEVALILGVIEPGIAPGFYRQGEIAEILEFADATGQKP